MLQLNKYNPHDQGDCTIAGLYVRAPWGTDVYEVYNDDGDVLYVGISHNAAHRLRQHSERAIWWSDARYVCVTRYQYREIAEAIEARLIEENKPLANIAPGSKRARKWPLEEPWRDGELMLAYAEQSLNGGWSDV